MRTLLASLLFICLATTQVLAQAASVADLRGRWQLLPVITKKHCYIDRQVGFIAIGTAVGDETYSARAWLRFIRQPTGKPGCKEVYSDVHDVVALEVSTFGERGTTNRYVVRFRTSLRLRAYPNQTWRYVGGKLRRVGPDGTVQATMVRRSCAPLTRPPAAGGDPCRGQRK